MPAIRRSQPKAYEISKAFYSACNRKNTEHLVKVTRFVQESVNAGELTAEEKAWFEHIIATAENGDWHKAMLDARAIMEEQQN